VNIFSKSEPRCKRNLRDISHIQLSGERSGQARDVPDTNPPPADHRPQPTQLPGPVLRVGADYAWRLLVLVLAAYVVVRALSHVLEVIVPLAAALFVTALLHPVQAYLRRHGVHRGIATLITVIVAFVAFGGLLTLVIFRAIDQIPQLADKVNSVLPSLRHWLEKGPLKVSPKTVNNLSSTVSKEVSSHSSTLISAAASTGKTVISGATGVLLAFFATVFFLYDGPKVWHFLTLISPAPARPRVDAAGRAAWGTLGHYVHGSLVVAVFHGLAIALVLGILGIPLVLPLAVLVAIGSFVPIVGAVVTGLAAVAVAGVTGGVSDAIIVAVVLVADNQIEAHVLQPFVVGRYVRIHPLAIVVSLTAGAVLAGILGALFAVPLVACASSAVRSLVGEPEKENPPPLLADLETG
jgi:putative heme transporter